MKRGAIVAMVVLSGPSGSHERLKVGSSRLHVHLVHLVLPLSIYLDFYWEVAVLEAVGPNHMA